MAVFEQGFPVPVPDGGGLPAQMKDSVLRDFLALEDLEYGDLVCAAISDNYISSVGNSNSVNVILLDEYRGIVLYSPSGSPKAKVFTVSATGATFGTEVAAGFETTAGFGGNFISETRFVESDYSGATVFTINWSTLVITVGTKLTYTPGTLGTWCGSFVNTLVPGVETITVIGSACAVVLTVSGTTLSQGTRLSLTYSGVQVCAEIAPNKYAVGCFGGSPTYWVLSTSGTTVTEGGIFTTAGNVGTVSLAVTPRYLLAFEQYGSAPYNFVNIL